jgi:hypothetical protein
LAEAMHKVGCSYGMELDINRGHVGFELYNVLAKGEAPPESAKGFKSVNHFSRTGTYPEVGMTYYMREIIRGTGNSPVPRWTGREARDFFYLVERQLLPRKDLLPMSKNKADGRWTNAMIHPSLLRFPQAMTRTIVYPRQENPRLRVHLLQLDLRWLETSLCVPQQDASCFSQVVKGPKQNAVAVLPLGPFSDSRLLLADGEQIVSKKAYQGGVHHLVLRAHRPSGPMFAVTAPKPTWARGSISIQGVMADENPVRGGALRVTNALCSLDSTQGQLLYASGLGVSVKDLGRVLSHAGCKTMILLAGNEPLALRQQDNRFKTIYGEVLPPSATSPSLLFQRSENRHSARIFNHVEIQPRRVWTAVQPERTRASALRHANRAAKEFGLPPAKNLEELCMSPYTDIPEMWKFRWRNPITGRICGGEDKKK